MFAWYSVIGFEEKRFTTVRLKRTEDYGGHGMRPKLVERKEIIRDYIKEYYLENDRYPTELDIAAGTGIPKASVHRFLIEMRDSGEISYEGRRSARTEEMERTSNKKVIPVLGHVACGPGTEEEEQFIEYIHMSEALVGRGEFFALIAKGESMVDAGIHPGDYVIVRRQQTVENGDLIIALLDGKNNLKKLVLDDGQVILRSCNKAKAADFKDITPEPGEELRMQGVAVGVYHSLG